jgi:chromosome segregation ATPase
MAGKKTPSASTIEESSLQMPTTYLITPEVTAAIAALNLALDRRKKLDEAVGSAPAQIAAAEANLQALRSELAAKEADIVWIDDAKVPAMEKEIATLVAAIEAKDREIQRTKGRVKALEDRAAEIDADVEQANNLMNLEASMAGQEVEEIIASELRLKVKELQSMFAKGSGSKPGHAQRKDLGFSDGRVLARFGEMPAQRRAEWLFQQQSEFDRRSY